MDNLLSNLAPVFVTLGMFGTIAFIFWVIIEGRRRRERLKLVTDFHQRLLDKIGSAREFGEFLQTDGGNRFLGSLTVERASPNERILRSIQTGIVLSCLGLGLLALGWMYPSDENLFLVFGIVILALGLGFVTSSVVSYRLSKAWGLLRAEGSPSEKMTS